MQTFLPDADFEKSAFILDQVRCRKQVVEAWQILLILQKGSGGFSNHPAVLAWKGYEPALSLYYNIFLETSVKRGTNFEKLHKININSDIVYPDWINNESILRTHRSRLLFKGKLDLLSNAIRKKYGPVSKYLKQIGYNKSLNVFRQPDYDYIKNAGQLEITEDKNWYLQFNWSEPDNLEYIWPTKITE